jgi:hypothetical protein
MEADAGTTANHAPVRVPAMLTEPVVIPFAFAPIAIARLDQSFVRISRDDSMVAH